MGKVTLRLHRLQMSMMFYFRIAGLFGALQGARILIQKAEGSEAGYGRLGILTPVTDEGALAYAALLLVAGIGCAAVVPYILSRRSLGASLLSGTVLSLGLGLLCARAAVDLPHLPGVDVSLFGMLALNSTEEQARYGWIMGGLAVVWLVILPAVFLNRWHALAPPLHRKAACALMVCAAGMVWWAGEWSPADAEMELKSVVRGYAAALLQGDPEEAAKYAESRLVPSKQAQIQEDKRIA
ncbi:MULTISPECIES: hypothetical protein [Paenibacillus]|uniref:hypothetical protein n=1 Tax=Paenibacillus TaxID=44249 RepID=UPI0022B8CE10|nr:hypothetical protein [Paenibacillus caseinilyticus]MCZ8523915.1 hypothetical protein [Paenibacillus caseinilyticus]